MNDVAKKILHHLHGSWRLSREISGSHAAQARGVAVFEKTLRPDELNYSEDVEITLSEGRTLKGYQHYIYRLEEDNKLNVYFEDGVRLFHSVDCISEGDSVEHKASHYCQPDTYTTSYFFGDIVFQIEHTVRGPKKDYISRTTYHKIE